MSYPTTIEPSPHFPGYMNGQGGLGEFAFEHNGAVYVFQLATGIFTAPLGDNAIHCFKSTDLGLSFTEQDAANAPVLDNGTAYVPVFTPMRDGDTVFMLAIAGANAPVAGCGTIFQATGTKLYKFDLGSETWTDPGSVPANDILPIAATGAGAVCSTQYTLQLVKRGAADYLLFYNGQQDTIATVKYGRVWYVPFDGASYGTPVKLPDQAGAFINWPVGAAVDSHGITQFLYINNDFSFLAGVLFSVGMSALGAFGATQIVTSNADPAGRSAQCSQPRIYSRAGTEYVAIAGIFWNEAGDTEAIGVIVAVAALNPVWTKFDLVLANYGVPASNIVPFSPYQNYFPPLLPTLCEALGTIAVVWGYATTIAPIVRGIFYAMTTLTPDLSGGWSTPAALFQAPDESANPDGHFTFAAMQAISLPMAAGIGVLGESLQQTGGGLAEISQFFLIAAAAAAEPHIHGTFVGFMTRGQFSGGTK